MLRMVTVWRAVSQLVMAIDNEKAASSRCGERMRIFRCGSWWMILYGCVLRTGLLRGGRPLRGGCTGPGEAIGMGARVARASMPILWGCGRGFGASWRLASRLRCDQL